MKLMAFYLDQSKQWHVTNIWEALSFRHNLTGTSIDRTYYDSRIEDQNNRLFPNRGRISNKGGKKRGNPFFSYASGSAKVNTTDSDDPKDLITHALFEELYSHQDKIILYEDFSKSSFSPRPKQEVQIFVKSAIPEYTEIVDNGSSYRFDILLELDHTIPAKYFYLWNGRIVIEIKNTHPVPNAKANDLGRNGYCIFQVPVKNEHFLPLPELRKLNDGDFSIWDNKLNQITTNFFNHHYKVFGQFRNQDKLFTFDLNKRRYNELANFEAEIESLKSQTNDLTTLYNDQAVKYNQLVSIKKQLSSENIALQNSISAQKQETAVLNKKVIAKRATLNELNNMPQEYKEALKDNRSLKDELSKQKYKFASLSTNIRHVSWFQRVFNWKNILNYLDK